MQRGHRISVDIDLFTDSEYGSINFSKIATELRSMFKITDNIENLDSRQIVNTVYIGDDEKSIVKLDFCYDEGKPIFPQIGSRRNPNGR